MTQMDTTATKSFVLGFYTQGLLAAFLDRGGDLEQLAAACGEDSTWLCHPPEKISVEQYFGMMSAAQSIVADPWFGLHVGQHMQVQGFDLLGQAMLKATSLGEAAQQVLVLEGLVHTLGHSQVLWEAGHLRFVWHCHYQLHPLAGQVAASVLAGIIYFGQRLADRPLPVMQVTFRHDVQDEGNVTEYRRICHSSCLFAQPHNSILLAEDVLGWPVSPGTVTATSAAGLQSWSNRVAHHLEDVLADGNPTLVTAASRFHLSTRTLQRRLEREGSSFQGILNSVRNRIAMDYLRYSSLSILEVSQLLGFREQTSFNHFFHAQQGASPGAFRHGAAAGPGVR